VETGTAWRAPTRRGACYFILPAISRVILLVFLLVSAAIDEENYFTFRWLWQWSSIGQGHQDKNINNNNSLHHWLDSRFSGKFSWRIENTRKSSLQPSILLVFLLVSISAAFCFRIRVKGSTTHIRGRGVRRLAMGQTLAARRSSRPACSVRHFSCDVRTSTSNDQPRAGWP
jgi:hypothetical protein